MSKIIHHKKKDIQNESPLKKNIIIITCQAGLEALVKRDSEKLGAKILSTRDRLIRAEADEKTLYKLLIGSRFSNRIYIELASEKITDFDELFSVAQKIKWRHHIPRNNAIVTEAMSLKSTLAHTPTLQSILKKAIVTELTKNTGTHHLYEDRE